MSEVIVLGAGVDELVAAHVLARAGHRVTVLQEHAVRERTIGWVPSRLARELALDEIVVERPDPWLKALMPDGRSLELWHDPRRSVESLQRFSSHDAQKWPLFSERMARLAALLQRLYLEAAPSLVDLRFALRVRWLGRQGMEDLMRLLPMPVAELLDEWFDCEALKGALGALAVRDLQQGPRSAGTAFRLLHFHVGAPRGVFRPGASNIAQVLRARAGLHVRDAKVARIKVRGAQVTGVTLENGDELDASMVVSGADPGRTLLELLEPGWLDPELVRALRHVRGRGVAAAIQWEFERAADWQSVTLAPSLDYVERACDDAKYGRASEQPCIDVVANGASATAHFQYAPYELRDGTWHDERRARLAGVAEKLLGSALPAIRKTTVLAPPDLERIEGWPEGQPHHAELALDQALWMRPVPELARYRTPIRGLWLCGPAMHPGAGVSGACGYNCAREILRA